MATARKSKLQRSLDFFLVPHPVLHPAGEKVFVPKEGLSIRFWIEGGLQVVGSSNTLEVNFNDPELLILAVTTSQESSVFRIPWNRLIAFELVSASGVPRPLLFPRIVR